MGKKISFINVNESTTICGPESDLNEKVTLLSQATNLNGAAVSVQVHFKTVSGLDIVIYTSNKIKKKNKTTKLLF